MSALAVLLALLVGLALGLLGGGGSILTVPIFAYVLDYAPKQAIAMSLPVVGVASLVGAVRHWRTGNVRLMTALLFGAVAMIGSFAGARVAAHVPGTLQLLLLGVVILVAAGAMARPVPVSLEPPPETHRPSPALLAVALGVGMLTGVVGVGGGFLIVPALVVLGRVPMKEAVGTSLLVIAMNAASGFVGYLGQVEILWTVVAGFTTVAVLGILIGSALVPRVPVLVLRRVFAVFLVAIGLSLLYQNRHAFSGDAPPTPVGAR